MKKFISAFVLICFSFSFVFADSFVNSKLDEQDKLLDDLELEEWQKKEVRRGRHDSFNFEEDDSSDEDDYYHEDD